MSKSKKKSTVENGAHIAPADLSAETALQVVQQPLQLPTKAMEQDDPPIDEDDGIEPEVIEPRGQLIAHCGAIKISLAELKTLPIPEATRTHKPIAHYTIVEAVLETLSFRHISCLKSEFAVSPDGMRMFGLLELNTEFNGCRFAIGIRNANDKSMRLAMTVGYRVFVCDNMAFKGDFTPVLAKHSRNLNLIDSISVGVDKIQRNFEPLKNQIDRWKHEHLQDNEARLIIYQAFLDGKLKAPHTLMPKVHQHYFNPEHEEFNERNLWSLSNAFTSAFKQLVPIRQFQVTAKLGDFMEQYVTPY